LGVTAEFDVERPFVSGACSLRIQTVLFGTGRAEIEQSLASIERAAEIAIARGDVSRAEVAYGDSSSNPVMDERELERLRGAFPSLARIDYVHFGANLGSAGGQNRLLADAQTDLVFFINPDVRFAPLAFTELVRPLRAPGIGATEGRQLPIEHPKQYDPETGETGWAAGACMMLPVRLAKALGGFDAESFFLYCDDVDLSWRIRLAGFKIVYQPSAGVFHDKRLSTGGELIASDIEEFYSCEARLILAYKYGRADLVKRGLAAYEASANANLRRAAEAYRRRMAEGRLPRCLNGTGVAEFLDANFTRHRFAL
jgi:GT2 family glycosyltransferase